MPSSRAESRFVLECVREPKPGTATELRATASLVFDWDRVVDMAERHGVAAFVRRAVVSAGVELPDAARARLETVTVSAMARSLQLNDQLKRVAAAVHDTGRSIIVLKGPVLARTIYSSVALRPFTDVDLVARPPDEDAVAGLLVGLGFAENSFPSQVWLSANGHHAEEAGFHRTFSGQAGTLIELHAEPLQLGLRPVCEAARWERAMPVPDLPGALMLAPEDQLVQLSVHLHKHGFSRLIWLKDLDLLLRRSGASLDWRVAEAVAHAEGVTTSVWHCLELAGQLLASPVPPWILARLRPPVWSRALDRLVWPMAQTSALDGTMRRRAVQFDAAESWRGMLPGLVLMGRRRDRARGLMRWILAHPRR